MEQASLNEILKALELHSDKITNEIDKRFDKLNNKINKKFREVYKIMNNRFDQVDQRLDRLEKRFAGQRIELSETQETIDFLSSKYVRHEKKLRKVID